MTDLSDIKNTNIFYYQVYVARGLTQDFKKKNLGDWV